WHYELERVEDPLAYKGVVFNEMKGAYSSPDDLLDEKSQQLLYPDSIYHFDSGGDPEAIPQLTYAQFKQFHDTFYHPSNARIFFYGNDDPAERLRILDAYLKDFDAIDVPSEIQLQPRLSQARRFVLPYDAGEAHDGQKSYLTLNWLLPEVGEPELTLGLSILAYILIETPASPLRKALIDSGLGEDLTGRGLETGMRQMFFSTGMKGVERENVGSVEKLILDTLSHLASQGIDPEMIAAAINTIEFRLRENNTGSFPRGLVVMLRALSTWNFDGDPLAPLAFERPLSAIKERIASGMRYFEGLIQEHLIENDHRVTLILEPDSDLSARREALERERLDQARRSMDESELIAIVENTQELKRRQETPDSPEALATIPALSLSDLDKEIKRIPLDVLDAKGARILFHDIPTNGILYLDVGFDLHCLPQEWLPFVPLFGRALLEMGTEMEDYVRLSQRIGRSTGGIRPSWFSSMSQGSQKSQAWLFLRGKAVTPQTHELLAILHDVLVKVRLDNRERFRQMVLEAKAEQETQLIPMGHRVINQRLRAHFNEADWANEQMNGVGNLLFLRSLLDRVENGWPAVLQTLESMRATLLGRDSILLNATIDGAAWDQVYPLLGQFVNSLPANPTSAKEWSSPSLSPVEGLTIPAQVNYVGKGADLYKLGYELHGSVQVITLFLRSTWLWEKVRVQGGAYGGFSLFDRQSGVLTFLSYRDPNLLGTLDVYNRTAEFLKQLDLSAPELTKSIIGAIGEMDAYLLPDAQGYMSMIRYLTGITDEDRQRLRDQVLATSLDDFRRFGEVLEPVEDHGHVVVMGSPDAMNAANSESGISFDTIKVL
ncbi:MAG: peptidase M16, partial [Chloroflexota bacterium]